MKWLSSTSALLLASSFSFNFRTVFAASGLSNNSFSFSKDWVSFDNDWINPDVFLQKDFNKTTVQAQMTIVNWADNLSAQGPWSVMNKTIVPPSGNKHDYMSMAPYSWPNCTGVGNKTQLTPSQIWTTCPYETLDGQFNPERVLLVNDTGAFNALADTVWYNTMAWVLTGSSNYSQLAAKFIEVWFIDADTAMNPNLNFAQMSGGPAGQVGTHTGVLDLKDFTKIVTGILLMRKANSPYWTSSLDTQMVNWTNTYIKWLTTAKIAIQEREALNNHGSFYFNQLAALYILVNNVTAAQVALHDYFSGIYLGQIAANGEQPLEAVRTRPYHYRTYNLAAMLTNARLANYTGFNAFNLTTKAGGTIQKACDFTMTVAPGDEDPTELYPDVAAVASIYGDPTRKYASFVAQGDSNYIFEPYFLWDQPFDDLVGNVSLPAGSGNGTTSGGKTSGSGHGVVQSLGLYLPAGTAIAFAVIFTLTL